MNTTTLLSRLSHIGRAGNSFRSGIAFLAPVALLGAVMWTSNAAPDDPRAGLYDNVATDRLMYGVLQSDLSVARRALANGASVNALNRCGGSPLISAITGPPSSCRETIEMLLDAGGDVNLHCAQGMTPLMCAVTAQNNEAVQLLLDAGADIDALDANAESASDYALQTENDEALRLITTKRTEVARASVRRMSAE